MASVFDVQKTQLQGQLDSIDARIAANQQQLIVLQAEKTKIQQDFADLRAAYLAWKGVPL